MDPCDEQDRVTRGQFQGMSDLSLPPADYEFVENDVGSSQPDLLAQRHDDSRSLL